MKENDTLISYLNELNQSGKIRYDDYSRLFDMACELGNADAVLSTATEDMAERKLRVLQIWPQGGIRWGKQMDLCSWRWVGLPSGVAWSAEHRHTFSQGGANAKAAAKAEKPC